MELGQPTGRITASTAASSKRTPTINYILGSPTDDQYQLKRQQKKLVRVAIIKARVNVVHTESSQGEANPIDDPISFHLVNPNRVIVPHYQTWYSPSVLMVFMCIGYWWIRAVW